MKAWMKYFSIALILLALAYLGFGYGLEWSKGFGVTKLGFTFYLTIALSCVTSTLLALCILFELARMWYASSPHRTVGISEMYRKFKSWLGKDGL